MKLYSHREYAEIWISILFIVAMLIALAFVIYLIVIMFRCNLNSELEIELPNWIKWILGYK